MLNIVKAFESFSYFTDVLSGKKHVTASAIQPLLDHMHKRFCWYPPMTAPSQKK